MNTNGEKRSMPKWTGFIVPGAFLVSTFLLAFSRIEDPDAWLHLVNGKIIWSAKGMPATEFFLYADPQRPYLYTSWLFGLLYYGSYHFFNIYGVIFLKAVLVTLVFAILLKDSLAPHRNMFIGILVLFFVALLCRHRFTERPDVVLMLFLSFSILAVNALVENGNSRHLSLLPLAAVLWSNSHSSIYLLYLPFAAHGLARVTGNFFRQEQANDRMVMNMRLKKLGLLACICFAASFVNPHGFHQYTLGAGFLNNPWFRQNIGEMASPDWSKDKELYWMIALVITSFLTNRRHFFAFDVFLVLPMLLLAFTSRRFIYPFFIVAGPVVARNFSSYAALARWKPRPALRHAAIFSLIPLMILSTSLTIANVEPFGNLDKQFGFGINETFVPEGALRFMDSRNITGRVLNTFHWGQYITWRDYPKRSAIVDGRCNIPTGLLQKLSQAPSRPEVLDQLHLAYGFEAILVNYKYDAAGPKLPLPPVGFDAGLRHPGWALVYWDDLSSVYVRRNGPYAAVALTDEYRIVKPANNLALLEGRLRETRESATILRELERNVATTDSISGNIYLGHIYNCMGRYREAIACFSRVRDSPLKHYLSFSLKGAAHAYEMLGDRATALEYYRRSYARMKDPVIAVKIATLSR